MIALLREVRDGLSEIGMLFEQLHQDNPDWDGVEHIGMDIQRAYERICDEIYALEQHEKRVALESAR